MGILTKKRYRFGGDFSMRDRDGERLVHHFSSGDVLPDDLAASLSKREMDALTGTGMLREIGAPPAPKPAGEPPRPWTTEEILQHVAWPRADVVDGQVTGGPRGYALTVLNKAARESDLRKAAWRGGETQILVHPVDGELMASISLTRLAPLLAAAGFGGR